MIDFLKKFFGSEESSSNVAKERLQLVLVHDRTDCSPELIDMIKEDIVESISKYIEIEKDGFDIKITKEDNGNAKKSTLVANIPINKLSRKR